MGKSIQVLIVEDEMIIAANISLQLTQLGYEVSAIFPRGEDALEHVKGARPDIVLLDIELKGELDGIETAKLLQKDVHIPIIFLTANNDEAHFNRAKETKPYAFISKPFKKLDLKRALELTVNLISEKQNSLKSENLSSYVLSDCIFVRHHDTMVKVVLKDILYVEAERNYCRIFTEIKEYLLVTTLKDMEEKLPEELFMRIHRSYLVNLSQILEVSTSHTMVSGKLIPLSKSKRADLLARLQTI